MRYVVFTLGFAVVAYYAYHYGYRQAVDNHPAYEASRQAYEEASQRFWEEMEAHVSDREKLCDQIFESVQEILADEMFADDKALHMMGDEHR